MKLKCILLYGLVILQTISSYVPNYVNMKMEWLNLRKSSISKRRDLIFYSIALNTIGAQKVNAERVSIIDKISTKDIIRYIEDEQKE